MRVIFMGTASFACPSLQALLDSPYEVMAVVTQPDRPKGRGREMSVSPVKELVCACGRMPVLQPEKVRREEFLHEIEALHPDLIVVAAFGQILPKPLLEMPLLGCVNVHASLLPKYRGAAPVHHAILNGETMTGVTLMFMDETLDTGDTICQEKTPILPEDNRATLESRLADLGARLLSATMPLLQQGIAPRTPQNPREATYAPMVRREEGEIKWSDSAVSLHNKVRAFAPSPGAYTYLHGQVLKIRRTEVICEESQSDPGTVIRLTASGPLIQTGERQLLLKEVQPESRNRMRGEEYARGYRIHIGEQAGDFR